MYALGVRFWLFENDDAGPRDKTSYERKAGNIGKKGRLAGENDYLILL